MFSIKDWGDNIKQSPKERLLTSKYVTGCSDSLIGEKYHYAKVGLEISPSDVLIFRADVKLDEGLKELCEKEKLIESIWYGVLDVMLIGPIKPINFFSCVLKHIEINPRRATRLAFRFAARQAVNKLLSESTHQKIYGWGYKK
ncbi:hypothetical protein LJC47_05645 [Desulfosarcina sp. OttesenSCG-928-B08]|nr:hypothetical protein [Desulfosarcina sp. OttesenSCG-928-B08]